jgi:hypothetical protein
MGNAHIGVRIHSFIHNPKCSFRFYVSKETHRHTESFAVFYNFLRQDNEPSAAERLPLKAPIFLALRRAALCGGRFMRSRGRCIGRSVTHHSRCRCAHRRRLHHSLSSGSHRLARQQRRYHLSRGGCVVRNGRSTSTLASVEHYTGPTSSSDTTQSPPSGL